MAVRVYSLAKELGLDSKALVDLCTRIGILNKGSALASLEDDEIARVKKHLAATAMSFEDYIKQSPTHIRWTGRGLSILPDSLTSSTVAIELDLSANKIGLSEDSIHRLSKMVSLKSLILSNNSIASLPESFGNLTNLETLDLSGNRLSGLPDSFSRLQNLKTLRLGGNTFSEMPVSLSELHRLVQLDFSNNQLTSIPKWIQKLAAVSQLFVGKNRLESLPDEICALSRLEELSVDGNALSRLPDDIDRLYALSILILNGNALSSLPINIGGCKRLEQLELEYNRLESLPQEIGALSRLRNLSLSDNMISALPDSIGSLSALISLDLTRNNLAVLPATIQRLVGSGGTLKQLYLHENLQLRIPPEILGGFREKGVLGSAIEGGGIRQVNTTLGGIHVLLERAKVEERKSKAFTPNSILQFYFKRQSGRSRKLREAKVLLVGQGGVGKSSLAKALLDPQAAINRTERQTDGIAILDWSVSEKIETTVLLKSVSTGAKNLTRRQRHKRKKHLRKVENAFREKNDELKKLLPVRVNIWDFGGQEIMHSTHQFF